MNMITSVKPYLPKIQDFYKIIDAIWSRNYLTNNGPVLIQYEKELGQFLGTNRPSVVTNGTTALQFAIRALKIENEVITTPFSYVASTSSLFWEKCSPIFVDIDERTLNINPEKIIDKITSKTSAILVTHTFGNPCEIEKIQKIAAQHNLKVIFDASHCFGTTYKGKSIFEYGDVSTLSLHATKLVHMVEGGAVFSNTPELLKRINFMRNFGHDGPTKFNGVGINGKNSEIHAAMGLAVLKEANKILEKRKSDYKYYVDQLAGLNLNLQTINPDGVSNFSYFPIIFHQEEDLIKALEFFETKNIYPRRYFYPSLNKLQYLRQQTLPISEDISKRTLCLPLYFQITKNEQDLICETLKKSFDN